MQKNWIPCSPWKNRIESIKSNLEFFLFSESPSIHLAASTNGWITVELSFCSPCLVTKFEWSAALFRPLWQWSHFCQAYSFVISFVIIMALPDEFCSRQNGEISLTNLYYMSFLVLFSLTISNCIHNIKSYSTRQQNSRNINTTTMSIFFMVERWM